MWIQADEASRSIIAEPRPRFDPVPFRDAGNLVDRDIAFGPLDGAEVSAVDSALMG